MGLTALKNSPFYSDINSYMVWAISIYSSKLKSIDCEYIYPDLKDIMLYLLPEFTRLGSAIIEASNLDIHKLDDWKESDLDVNIERIYSVLDHFDKACWAVANIIGVYEESADALLEDKNTLEIIVQYVTLFLTFIEYSRNLRQK